MIRVPVVFTVWLAAGPAMAQEPPPVQPAAQPPAEPAPTPPPPALPAPTPPATWLALWPCATPTPTIAT